MSTTTTEHSLREARPRGSNERRGYRSGFRRTVRGVFERTREAVGCATGGGETLPTGKRRA